MVAEDGRVVLLDFLDSAGALCEIELRMARYVALLRGINVGGKNVIKMPALKACFEGMGLGDLVTYIQSGNVLFTANEASPKLALRIESALAAQFGYQASLVLRNRKQMA